jgi:PIN domain nuclease of toxin-antitoxin system
LRLLIDTHIALWLMSDDPRLTRQIVDLLDRSDNEVVISVVSVWEVAVKWALGQDRADPMPLSGAGFLAETREVGLEPLAISAGHVVELDRLKPHHRDPFDRLLVAQATSESMRLLTHDAKLAAYGDVVIVV